jgi:oligoribonuclease (3'-5' exoribonuclease)
MNDEARRKILVGMIAEAFIAHVRTVAADNELKTEALAERLGIETEVTEITDMDAYLEHRAQKAGLIAPCVNPYCTTDNGQRATVDRRKKKSGACCKVCMNYVCSHPDCVAKAKLKGWKHYTHAWGTKIAEQHKDYRTSPNQSEAQP